MCKTIDIIYRRYKNRFTNITLFLAIYEEKNISKAAESLHMEQPSLSKQIKDLEKELGITLFVRDHRQITLTDEGYFLGDRAQELIEMADQISLNHPKTNFKFIDDSANNIQKQINDGSLDFGLIMGDRTLEEFESLILPERNEFTAIFNKDHPLAQKNKIFLQDLVAYPIISSSQTLVSDKFRNLEEKCSSF
ncbi:LysR family transcriptional regulator [Lactobacillus johnsonii]|uniref:LysR family transcriptional regulator n=1 Tax=Lactobacillus johnsonii TaxID=33959 RepID=UPI003D77F045